MPIIRVVAGSYEHNLLGVALDTSKELFQPLFHFTPHTQSIRCLAWSKRTMVSGSNDEHIRMYDLQNRKELGTLMHHSGSILALEFFKSKWLFSCGSDNKICIWRTKDWEILAELKGHTGPVVSISVHNTGRVALTVGEDRKCILWNLMSARKAAVRKLRQTPRQISFDPNSKANYVIAYDRSFELYDENGDTLKTFNTKSVIHQIRFYKSQLVVSLDNGSINFYDLNAESTEPLTVLQGHSTRVKDFAIMDQWMASVSSDGNLVVWDLTDNSQVGVYSVNDRLNCVTIMPDDVEAVKRVKPEVDVEDKSEYETDGLSEDEQPKPQKKKRARVVVRDG